MYARKSSKAIIFIKGKVNMDDVQLKEYGEIYGPIISKIIDSNIRFYRFVGKIKFGFGYDDDSSVLATFDRKTDVIMINMKSLNESCLIGD